MADETPQAPEAQGESADAFIVEQMRAGADEETIVAGLVERGADPAQARRRVEVVYPQVMRAAEAEVFEPRLLVPAVLVGLAAAVAGGIGWALIAVTTDYEIGFAALGIGILAGYAVVLATRGRKGLPLQVAAVVSSLLGIALGKYFAYVWELKDAVRAEFGDEAADSVGFLDSEVIDLFVEDADRVFGGYDLLWAAF
ncbi:MAG: hypothetical protein ACRDNN_10585, partial [Gaiellaceae bacterium]